MLHKFFTRPILLFEEKKCIRAINSHTMSLDIILIYHKLSAYPECFQTLGNSIKLGCSAIMYSITFILMASGSMEPLQSMLDIKTKINTIFTYFLIIKIFFANYSIAFLRKCYPKNMYFWIKIRFYFTKI